MQGLFYLFIAFIAASGAFGQEWDANNYPNPTGTGYAQCNMKSPSMLCDPDQVLTEQERYRLNYELNQLEAATRQPNGQNFCEKKGVVAGIALAKRVRGGSENAVKAMSNDMLRRWTLDQQCSKSIVIVVSTEDRKFWAARDSRVPVYAQEFTDIFNNQKPLFKDGNFQEALLNVIRETRQTALAKQTIPGPGTGGGGPPFNPKYPDDDGRGGARPKPSGGGGFGIPKIPYWFWILLILVVIPSLCCCGCLYYCCCRKKADGTPARRQGPSDLPDEGGYAPSAPPPRRTGGGGFQGLLGGLGGAAIGNTISGMFNRNRGAPRNVPANVGGGGGAGGNFDGPPPYQPPVGQRAGAPLYPSVTVKDEGGGGQW